MGLLVSDTMHLDLVIEDSIRWQNSLIDYVYLTEPTYESDEYEAADQIGNLGLALD